MAFKKIDPVGPVVVVVIAVLGLLWLGWLLDAERDESELLRVELEEERAEECPPPPEREVTACTDWDLRELRKCRSIRDTYLKLMIQLMEEREKRQ